MTDETVGATRDIVVYRAPDGGPQVEVLVSDDTVWLTQRQMAGLFGSSIPTVNEHIKNVYAEGELTEAATLRESRIVRTEGSREVRRRVQHYNLDVIISGES